MIEVRGSQVTVIRKAPKKVLVIRGALWGEGPIKKTLPDVMLEKSASVLLIPMADYSCQLIDLSAYMKSPKDNDAYLLGRLEGGAFRGPYRYDRTPVSWALDRVLSPTLIQGHADSIDNVTWDFFIDLENSWLTMKDGTPEDAIACMVVNGADDQETLLRTHRDTAEYNRLLKVAGK